MEEEVDPEKKKILLMKIREGSKKIKKLQGMFNKHYMRLSFSSSLIRR